MYIKNLHRRPRNRAGVLPAPRGFGPSGAYDAGLWLTISSCLASRSCPRIDASTQQLDVSPFRVAARASSLRIRPSRRCTARSPLYATPTPATPRPALRLYSSRRWCATNHTPGRARPPASTVESSVRDLCVRRAADSARFRPEKRRCRASSGARRSQAPTLRLAAPRPVSQPAVGRSSVPWAAHSRTASLQPSNSAAGAL